MSVIHIEVLQENILPILKTATKAISSKPQLPILSSLLVEVSKGKVTIAATDLYMGIKASIPAKVDTTTSIAIPGKLLLETISAMGPGIISLDIDKQTVTIGNNRVSTSLQCQVADDFPSFPEVIGEGMEFLVSDLATIASQVGFSAATDQARLILTTILLEKVDGVVQAVATDGFRLSVLKLADVKIDFDQSLLIPAKAVNEVVTIAQLTQVEKVTVFHSLEQKQLLFAVGGTHLFVRLVEGEFPPYQKIVPSSVGIEVSVDAQEFQAHVKQALIIAREVSNVVQLSLQGEQLTLRASSSSLGSFIATLPVTVNKPGEVTIAFNAKYLLDFIMQVKPDRILIGINDSLKPAVITQEGKPELLYIVMPFRLNE